MKANALFLWHCAVSKVLFAAVTYSRFNLKDKNNAVFWCFYTGSISLSKLFTFIENNIFIVMHLKVLICD